MAETKAEQIRNEKRIAHGVGFMTGVAAVRDCADTGRKSYKESAELIEYGIKFSQKDFMAGLAAALVIGLTADNNEEALRRYLATMREEGVI